MQSQAKTRRCRSLVETIVLLAISIIAGNATAGIGTIILFDGHADQAQPRLPHRPPTATEPNLKISPLTQLDAPVKNCVTAPPRYHDISNRARRQNRELHLLVHEDDRKQIAQAIAESVRQRRGYATTSAAAISTEATVYLLAPPEWDEKDFAPLQPYGEPPRSRTDRVSLDYPHWVRQIHDRRMPNTEQCPDTL